jgi:MFS family permease
MEKLDRKDYRFIALCLAVIAAGGLITISLFYRAFPEASIQFRVNRGEARLLAEKFLAQRGRNIAGSHFAGRFDVEDDAKVYLERELGLEKAGRFYGKDAKVWRWSMRWFRSGTKEEERVELTPLGDLAAFESVQRDDAAGPALREGQAREISRRFLESRGLAAALTPIEATPIVRAHRTDWRFVEEKSGFRMGEATVRYQTVVSGTDVVEFQEFVHVPENWQRDYGTLRSKNETANTVGNFFLILTFLAMVGLLVTRIVRHDVRWELVAGFGVVAFLLALASAANGLPLALFNYDTRSPLSSYVTQLVVTGVLGAVGVGAGIALVVAAAEPIFRERFPQHLSLSKMFSARGFRSKGFFRGVLLGYALTAFFFAYQVIFYVIAAKLGAWAPSEVKYDNMLSTAFPWVTVLFVGFLPAVLEEGSSRLFSISLLDKLGAGRFVAVVLPAFIWGFNHAAYPNQPFYIRGLEVGLAGCAIGVVMLRWGALPLLVWHFTVDALYTALLLLRSGNPYYVITGAISSLVLLLPLAASAALYMKRGGFEPSAGLTNGDEGTAPAPVREAPSWEEVPPVHAVRRPVLIAAAAVALLTCASFLIRSQPASPLTQDATGPRRASEIARAFLRANGVDPQAYRSVTYAGTGLADDEQTRGLRPDEVGSIPGLAEDDMVYVLRQGGPSALERLTRAELPLAFWVTRFFRPLQKEEWKILVDVRRSHVIGFLNPIEEKAAVLNPPGDEAARRRARDAAERLGYPAGSYAVLEVGTRDRPNRKDTTVVLEAAASGVGEARPRLTAVFHGGRLAAFYPSIHVPESFLRAYESQSPFEPILIGIKVIAIGSFLGFAVVLFIRLVKSQGIGWRQVWPSLLAVSVVAGAYVGNGARALLRAFPTQFTLERWYVVGGVSLSLLWILLTCAVLVAFVLLSGGRPGWRRALRVKGTLPDAFLRAAIAVAGLAGLERAAAVIARRIPDLFDPGAQMPPALERMVPALDVLGKAGLFTLLAGTAASALVLGGREKLFRSAAGKAAAAAALALALIPTGAHSWAEFLGVLVPALLAAAWMLFAALTLLADHVAAWVFFGALASAGPAVWRLLSQPAAEDRIAGLTAAVLVAAAAAALVAGRRREPALEPAMPASPLSEPIA